MGETVTQRIKRINANGKLFLADTKDGPGDLFMVTKYLAENGLVINGRFSRESLVDTYQEVLENWGGCRVWIFKDSNKDKFKKVLDVFDYKGAYNSKYYLELGTHTLAKNSTYKHTPEFPYFGNLTFQFNKDFGARKIPTLRYDLRTFFPKRW